MFKKNQFAENTFKGNTEGLVAAINLIAKVGT